MKSLMLLLLVVALATGSHSSGQVQQLVNGSPEGCEPGAGVELSLRPVSVEHQGPRAKVILEVSLTAAEEPVAVRLFSSRATTTADGGARMGMARTGADSNPPAITGTGTSVQGRGEGFTASGARRFSRGISLASPELEVALDRSLTGPGRFVLDLERGFLHQIYLDAEVTFSDGEVIRTRAYVPVNLDPRRQPRRREDVVEYRGGKLP